MAFSPIAKVEAWWSPRWVPAQAAAVALLASLTHLASLRRSPFLAYTVLDASYYDEWAHRIAGGEWIGSSAFHVDPAYAYLLGVLYKIAGDGPLLPRILNGLLLAATAALAASTAKAVWSSKTAALIAGLCVASFIPAVHYAGQLEKTTLSLALFTLGVSLFLHAAERRSARALLAAGFVAGLAALARGNTLALVAAGAGFLALARGRLPRADAASGDPAPLPARARARAALLFTLGAACVLGVSAAHNYAASGGLVLTTTNLGINLYLGNHAGNEHGFYTPPPFVSAGLQTELPEFRAEAERHVGDTLSDSEVSSYWTSAAWAAVTADPGAAIARSFDKVRLCLSDLEFPDSEDAAIVAEWSPLLRSPILRWGVLFPLAVLGAVVGWRRPAIRVIALASALYLATLIPFFIMGRLRVPVLGLLAVLAAGGATWLVQALWLRHRASLALAAGVLAAAALAAFARPEWLVAQHRAALAISWNNLGSELYSHGDVDQAVRAYERAVETQARAVPAALRALGQLYKQRGDHRRAEAALRRLLEIKPDSAAGRAALLALHDQNGRAAVFADVRQLRTSGREQEAIEKLQRWIETSAYDEDARYMLGSLMASAAAPDAMVNYFSRMAALDPKPQTSHYFWAVGLTRRGEHEAAVAQLQRALEIDPAHEMSQLLWGEILERQGRHAEALEHVEEATRIHPDYRAALEAAARLASSLGLEQRAADYRARAAVADPSSPRRYLHWARYLEQRQRFAAALAEVNRMLAVQPDNPEALQLRDRLLPQVAQAAREPGAQPATSTGAAAPPRAFGRAERERFVAQLRTEAAREPAWILYDGHDPDAVRLAHELAAAFREAGWEVGAVAPSDFPLRAGVTLLAAESTPSAAVGAVDASLTAIGLTHQLGTGYREFADERRRADPSWRGFTLAPEQTFLLVVGRN